MITANVHIREGDKIQSEDWEGSAWLRIGEACIFFRKVEYIRRMIAELRILEGMIAEGES